MRAGLPGSTSATFARCHARRTRSRTVASIRTPRARCASAAASTWRLETHVDCGADEHDVRRDLLGAAIGYDRDAIPVAASSRPVDVLDVGRPGHEGCV